MKPSRGVRAPRRIGAPLRWFAAPSAALLSVSFVSLLGAGGAPAPSIFGDVDCSGALVSVDSLKVLRFSAGFPQPQISQTCLIGYEVPVDGVSRIWGDNDCSGVVNSVDALKTLRQMAALSYAQSEPCPDIGSTVQADFGQ